MIRNRKRSIFASLLTAIFLTIASQALALSIGTMNIEYFDVSGKKAYSPSDCANLAKTITFSGADILALQEIKGNAAMRYFVTKFLPKWKYAGNDTGGRQDLYFLWNSENLKLLDGPFAYGANASFRFEGKSYKLNDRPNLVATFLDKEKNRQFTLVNVHLKSQSTRGKKNQDQAERYNEAKRNAQIDGINKLVSTLKGPVFILGDYNTDTPTGCSFPLLALGKGRYSYDNSKSNLDYIGFANVKRAPSWVLYEVESAIAARSTKRTQHPDHDMVVLSIDGEKPSQTVIGLEEIPAPLLIAPQKGAITAATIVSKADTHPTTVYITKTGEKYHTAGCSYPGKDKIPISLSEAKAKGYTPCSKCHPTD